MSKQTGAAITNSQAATENFEAELASIRAKGKDLKGEQRVFYTSIVQRVENNSQTLNDLRKEHTALREKLGEVVREKHNRNKEANLEGDIKHTNHEVNLLKKKIDRLKHNKEESINRQRELEVILANFQNAAETQHPEEQRIRDMKNKLDKANIKNSETTHLMKIYQQIIHLLDRQKMHWTPILQEKQQQIAQKQRDIADLTLIARDSKHSLTTAKNEYNRTFQQCAAAKTKRDAVLDTKKSQLKPINARQQLNDIDNKGAAKPQQSLNSQPSVLRNKLNKVAREKREERFRQVSSVYDEIREKFGTNEPEKIQQFFIERREHSATLQKQIEDLKEACGILEKKSSQMKAALEEAEYASSKGIGGNRLLMEGKRILEDKKTQLAAQQRLMAASESHQKSILTGVAHLQEVMSLVQPEEEEQLAEPEQILNWVSDKSQSIKNILDEEDVDYIALTNKQVLASYIQRGSSQFDLQQVDSSNRVARRVLNPHKPAAKDKAVENTTRVLDRNQVKMMAVKQYQTATRGKKPTNQ